MNGFLLPGKKSSEKLISMTIYFSRFFKGGMLPKSRLSRQILVDVTTRKPDLLFFLYHK